MSDAQIHELAAKREAPSGHTRSILCIDADDESRHLIAEILDEHEVDFALTMEDAVQLAGSRTDDLCFIDLAVPGCADVDLVRELRAFDGRVPVVICSNGAAASISPQKQACLAKPLSAAAVRETAIDLLLSARAPD